jgi:hypothetical protein
MGGGDAVAVADGVAGVAARGGVAEEVAVEVRAKASVAATNPKKTARTRTAKPNLANTPRPPETRAL